MKNIQIYFRTKNPMTEIGFFAIEIYDVMRRLGIMNTELTDYGRENGECSFMSKLDDSEASRLSLALSTMWKAGKPRYRVEMEDAVE